MKRIVFLTILQLVDLSSNVTCAPALGGMDVIACALLNGTAPCRAKGNKVYSTNYTSLDKSGSIAYTTEFWFESEENMIAFENSPFTYAPLYGGYCALGISDAHWLPINLGPGVDLVSGWRVYVDPNSSITSLLLFADSEAAQVFLNGLPHTKHSADKVWSSWFGFHGTVPPFAEHGGPFNTAKFTKESLNQVKRGFLNDPLPENDPTNETGWIPYEPLTDEFDGDTLDPLKWSTNASIVGWKGRMPGLFDPSNIEVIFVLKRNRILQNSDGKFHEMK